MVSVMVVRHQKLPHVIPAQEALAWFQESEFADTPPYFLTHWKTHKKFFYALGGLVAFEETPRELVIAGEPLLADSGATREQVLEIFCQMAERKKKGVCGYYVGPEWESERFSKAMVGASMVVPFESYDLKASRFKEVRRALRKGVERGFSVVSIAKTEEARVKALYSKWRSRKSALDVQFILSQPQPNHMVHDYEEWFAVEKDGELLAFCSLLPYVKKGHLSFYLDHLIRHPDKESHAMSYLLSFLLETLNEQGVHEFNLGLSPFVNAGAKTKMEKLFALFYKWPFWYRPKGLHSFKKKFGGQEQSEYCFFNHDENKMRQLAEMADVTFHVRSEA